MVVVVVVVVVVVAVADVIIIFVVVVIIVVVIVVVVVVVAVAVAVVEVAVEVGAVTIVVVVAVVVIGTSVERAVVEVTVLVVVVDGGCVDVADVVAVPVVVDALGVAELTPSGVAEVCDVVMLGSETVLVTFVVAAVAASPSVPGSRSSSFPPEDRTAPRTTAAASAMPTATATAAITWTFRLLPLLKKVKNGVFSFSNLLLKCTSHPPSCSSQADFTSGALISPSPMAKDDHEVNSGLA